MKTILLALALGGSLLAQSAFRVSVTGHGRPMILIPGLSSSGETWDSTVAHFKDRFECHVVTVAGFAGVPRVPYPMVDRVVADLAAYIRDHKLEKPALVGHSLGGFIALRFASEHPELPGAIVSVDGYTSYLTLTGGPTAAAMDAKAVGEQIRQGMRQTTREAFEASVKAGAGTRNMVSRDSDFATLVRWGLASDPTAVADAMGELYGTDLRPQLGKITAPTLMLAAWQSYAEYTDHVRHEAELKRQFAGLRGVQIEINDTARHFIMWDDPQWMFAHMTRFLDGK